MAKYVCVGESERKPVNLRGCVYPHFAFNFFDLFYLVCTFNSLHVLAHSWSWPHIHCMYMSVCEKEEGLLHAFELRLFHGASFLLMALLREKLTIFV